MAKHSVSRAGKAQSRSRPTTRRVSPRAMRQALLAIASRHFNQCFNEMCGYYGQVNPNGHSYIQQSLRAMREVLEDRERRRPDRRGVQKRSAAAES